MESTVGSDEVRTSLSELLERVAGGERITITRHGVPVAVLVPPPTPEALDVRSAVEAMRRFRKGRSLGGSAIREMIEDGRRF
jgi:prevent-host-death family protein